MYISMAKPEYKDKITKELLKIRNYKYDTEECKNIIYGKIIEAFDKYIEKANAGVKAFVEEQTHNTRNSVKKKAEKLIKKWEK
jgi:transaldolase